MTNLASMRVFIGAGGRGGNAATIVLDARGMSDERMRALAAEKGYECGFVEQTSPQDFSMRFFVPEHEMEMCGHATIGALWALRREGLWTDETARVTTQSGLVRGFVRNGGTSREVIEITQPPGRLEAIQSPMRIDEILQTLGATRDELLPYPILNAATSRVKTLVPLVSVQTLDALKPDFHRMKATCAHIESTGLYPFAIESASARVFHARQFPRSSGYAEDPATGIAAAALLYGLRTCGLIPFADGIVTVHQGRAMGSPSRIQARFSLSPDGGSEGCFISGEVAAQPE